MLGGRDADLGTRGRHKTEESTGSEEEREARDKRCEEATGVFHGARA
jgi:hypothetical protein